MVVLQDAPALRPRVAEVIRSALEAEQLYKARAGESPRNGVFFFFWYNSIYSLKCLNGKFYYAWWIFKCLEGIWSEYGENMMKGWSIFKHLMLKFNVFPVFSSSFESFWSWLSQLQRSLQLSACFDAAGGLRPGGGPSTPGSGDAGDQHSSEVDWFEAWGVMAADGAKLADFLPPCPVLPDGWFIEVSPILQSL